jgi:hypothetical protein
MTDERFYALLEPTEVTKDGAISVRSLVAGAVRIAQELVYPDDTLSNLKKVGESSHPSVIDYIANMSSIKPADNENAMTTVRDLVAKFGPELAARQ